MREVVIESEEHSFAIHTAMCSPVAVFEIKSIGILCNCRRRWATVQCNAHAAIIADLDNVQETTKPRPIDEDDTLLASRSLIFEVAPFSGGRVPESPNLGKKLGPIKIRLHIVVIIILKMSDLVGCKLECHIRPRICYWLGRRSTNGRTSRVVARYLKECTIRLRLHGIVVVILIGM